MIWRVRQAEIGGAAEVPGDKSIGHRALMIAALARGSSRITNLPTGADVASTATCLEALGIAVSRQNGTATVEGGEFQTGQLLDAGNSGTTMRLLTGLLAGQGVAAELAGDESLRRRPMGRIVEPLALMGANIRSTGGRPPLVLQESRLQGLVYQLPVASAQVKSSLLFAGLGAQGETTIIETLPTRDHTERMFGAAGITVESRGTQISIGGGQRPRPIEISIPGDLSSAAFLLVAAAIHGSTIRIRNVGLNPSRTGILDILRGAGCSVDVVHESERLGEPAGKIVLSGRPHGPIVIVPDRVPAVIDELPLLALLATQAPGMSTIEGASELRVKESDRIRSVAQTLTALGADIVERADGFTIRGPVKLRGTRVSSYGDHRIAMMLAIAGSIASGETVVEEAGAAAISFPEFPAILGALGGRIDVE
ncbi:MAG TPA: 3-phosphoshikimate 1-carboxyvinyltransferase [Chloroflexota bacterium]|nr:3-phosphoshikimate 1-carboxyvinyltransferase [Chloroflexota bacterium]